MNYKEFVKKEPKFLISETGHLEKYGTHTSINFYTGKDQHVVFDIWDDGRFTFKDLSNLDDKTIKDIFNFINQSYNEWFSFKYNIVLGKDIGIDEEYACAYEKFTKSKYLITDNATKQDLKMDEFQFTEKEIDDLKSHLPENMAKIVDLAKVEVIDE